MKWTNSGKELVELFSKYRESFDITKGVILFGAGQVGEIYGNILLNEGMLKGFIDNNISKTEFAGKDIISWDKYLKCYREIPIIITCAEKNYPIIRKQLEGEGLNYACDFLYYKEYFGRIYPTLLLYSKKKLFVEVCQICLTERCTLKCKKCAHACNMVKPDNKDLGFEDIKKSADSYFKFVDYAGQFVLIGGEPLLSKYVCEAVEYIGRNYRQQIGLYCITTNGTIIPNDDLLEACKEYNVCFDISNYSVAIPRLKNNYKKLTEKLSDYGIKYYLSKEKTWVDYGFEYVDRNKQNLEKVFDECATPCHEVRGNRFYQCVMARTVSENMYGRKCDDYMNLDLLEGEEGKKLLLEYSLGFSEKGYMDMCNNCNGKDANSYPIPAAEQM